MKLRIIGGGALGLLFTAKLAQAGYDIELVTRSRGQAELIRQQGLQFTQETGVAGAVPASLVLRPAAVSFEEAAACEAGESCRELPDAVLLMVKQTAVSEELARHLKDQLKPSARLVCFQNGIGHLELLQRYIAPEQLLAAVTTEGALRVSPNHVAHTGTGITWLGGLEAEFAAENDKGLVKKFQNMLSYAGFSAFVSNNITSKVWNKLLINAAINPVTAVLQVRNGLLVELPAARALMRALFEEGVLLADRLGIELAPDLWEQLLNVCRLTANNRSSMLQDVLSRRGTEIGAITGGLLDKARAAGVALPAHDTMFALVKATEQQWNQ